MNALRFEAITAMPLASALADRLVGRAGSHADPPDTSPNPPNLHKEPAHV